MQYPKRFRQEIEKKVLHNIPVAAKGRVKERGMNKLEKKYADHLELLKAAGEVLWYEYEAIKLRLADNTFYNPDFLVLNSAGELEIHETKGFMRDDANVKLKSCEERFPFPFFLVKAAKGGAWDIRKIGNK